MEWFSDRLSHDFGIEFLSISSLWIFVDMGLILGSNLSFSPEKNLKIIISKITIKMTISKFRILELKKKEIKNRKFLDSKYFWSIRKKDCDTKSAAWFGLVTLSPETHGCPPCPEALRLLLVIVSAFLGLVYPSSRFKRSFSVWFVFHSKTLFSSRPITDSTNTLDFTSV